MVKTIKKDLAKVNKLLHPKSRKAQKLHQKANRLATREKAKKVHSMKENALGEKLIWFKKQLLPNVRVYSSDMFKNIVEKYLKRFDEELEQISIVHSVGKRKNRRYANREDIINLTVLQEKNEFDTCGIEVPDLFNEQQVAYLRNWNEELRFLPNFKLKRYTLKEIEKRKVSVVYGTLETSDTKEPEDKDATDEKKMSTENEMEEDESDEQSGDMDESDNEGDEEEGEEEDDDDNDDDDEDEDDEWADILGSDEENESTRHKIILRTKSKKKKTPAEKKKKIPKPPPKSCGLMETDS